MQNYRYFRSFLILVTIVQLFDYYIYTEKFSFYFDRFCCIIVVRRYIVRTIVHVCIPGNGEIIYIATNSGRGYTSRIFDNSLGSVDTFILDGIYIFADKVSIIIIAKLAYIYVCIYTHKL